MFKFKITLKSGLRTVVPIVRIIEAPNVLIAVSQLAKDYPNWKQYEVEKLAS